MSDFAQFRELVMRDAALQKELREIADEEALSARVTAAGRERGFAISGEDLEGAVRANARAWIERWLHQ